MAKVNEHSEKKSPAHNFARHGARLKALRSARGLTLEQLSRMAGVSKAMLSQIEQEKVNPTVAVMLKIAGALRLNIGDLIDSPMQENIFRIIPASDERYTFRSDPLCTIRTLSPLNLEKSIEFYHLKLEAGGELHSEPHFPGTEEFLHLTRGRLGITSGDQTAEIKKGDSIHYRVDIPHTLRNTGKGPAEAYMIVRYRSE
ncbi:MAG: XRE family transcriptional regulator [Planctomycetota bacterium]|nr:XRE family transcriptional regulator [Planctomycetota bacterium]